MSGFLNSVAAMAAGHVCLVSLVIMHSVDRFNSGGNVRSGRKPLRNTPGQASIQTSVDAIPVRAAARQEFSC
jgi:hypothetical protein